MAVSEVAITYVNIILYALSYQLQRPVEPYLLASLIRGDGDAADDEGAANRAYGRLTSFFSAIQTVGSPVVGTLLDRIGPKKTSVLVFGGSAASYWILSVATTPALLFLSKIPTLLQHAFLVGQAIVVSQEGHDATARAAALGRMTTMYTIGATVGPALGGYLATSDMYAGARLAVVGSVISVILSLVFLRDRPGNSGVDSALDKPKKAEQSFIRSLKRTILFLRHETLGPLLFVKLLNGVSSSAFSTVLPLVLANRMHFTTAQLGYYMSASSISVAIFSAVGMGPLMKAARGRAERLASLGIGLRCLSMIAFGFLVSSLVSSTARDGKDATATATWGLATTALASIAMSLSSHTHATSLTTLITGSVSVEERGAVVGLEHGLFSCARIVGPPLGAALLSRSESGLWSVIAICLVMDVVLMMRLGTWRGGQARAEKIDGQDMKPLVEDFDSKDHSD